MGWGVLMDNSEIIDKIKELTTQDRVLEIEELLISEIERTGYDTNLMIRLALAQLLIPINDPDKCIEYINIILENENNPYALMILCDVHHNYFSGIDSSLFDRINAVKTSDNIITSVIELIKSWYYENINDYESQKNCLLRSIQYNNKDVLNYFYLGKLFLKTDLILGKQLIKKALDNVKNIFQKNYKTDDCTNINNYINEMFRGVSITQPVYDWMKSFL
jgi:tetratricopeptide (TPR) repeat protein